MAVAAFNQDAQTVASNRGWLGMALRCSKQLMALLHRCCPSVASEEVRIAAARDWAGRLRLQQEDLRTWRCQKKMASSFVRSKAVLNLSRQYP